MIQTIGEKLHIEFNRFDTAESYDLFLKCKKLPESQLEYNYETDTYTIETHVRYAPVLGLKTKKKSGKQTDFPKFLFQHQVEILKLALAAKRYAVWANIGFGKTLIELEFARQVVKITGGRVLILTLNEIVRQTIEESQRFYGDSLPVLRLYTREEMRRWCAGLIHTNYQIAITNYEKMNPDERGQEVPEIKMLAGLVLDESSRLKAGGGKQKWAIIKSAKGVPYKLSATATPAPNDYIEFASQASFLERMRDENEIIWTFFAKDKQTGEWTVKTHAREAFFEWMAAWSIYLKTPQAYGWSTNYELPPEPEIIIHELDATLEQTEQARIYNVNHKKQAGLFVTESQGVTGRSKLSQIAKGFVYLDGKKRLKRISSVKPDYVADIIRSEVADGRQVLVWTIFDEESEILAEKLGANADKRTELERLLKIACSEYQKTERTMFEEIPFGGTDEKLFPFAAKEHTARKKELQYFLDQYSAQIKQLESELAERKEKDCSDWILNQDFAVLTGSLKKEKREEIIDSFRRGELPVLISKASLLGYGMNFQNCGAMVFSGWNDSFESFFQAVGRAVRFGQTRAVRVHLPFIRELEYEQLENIFRKHDLFRNAIAAQ